MPGTNTHSLSEGNTNVLYDISYICPSHNKKLQNRDTSKAA